MAGICSETAVSKSPCMIPYPRFENSSTLAAVRAKQITELPASCSSATRLFDHVAASDDDDDRSHSNNFQVRRIFPTGTRCRRRTSLLSGDCHGRDKVLPVAAGRVRLPRRPRVCDRARTGALAVTRVRCRLAASTVPSARVIRHSFLPGADKMSVVEGERDQNDSDGGGRAKQLPVFLLPGPAKTAKAEDRGTDERCRERPGIRIFPGPRAAGRSLSS